MKIFFSSDGTRVHQKIITEDPYSFIKTTEPSSFIAYQNGKIVHWDYVNSEFEKMQKCIVIKGKLEITGKLVSRREQIEIIDENGITHLISNPDIVKIFQLETPSIKILENKSEQTNISFLLNGISYQMSSYLLLGENVGDLFVKLSVENETNTEFQNIEAYYSQQNKSNERRLGKSKSIQHEYEEKAPSNPIIENNVNYVTFPIGKVNIKKGHTEIPIFKKTLPFESFYEYDLCCDSLCFVVETNYENIPLCNTQMIDMNKELAISEVFPKIDGKKIKFKKSDSLLIFANRSIEHGKNHSKIEWEVINRTDVPVKIKVYFDIPYGRSFAKISQSNDIKFTINKQRIEGMITLDKTSIFKNVFAVAYVPEDK